jgi:hypothetical protein
MPGILALGAVKYCDGIVNAEGAGCAWNASGVLLPYRNKAIAQPAAML